MASESGASIGRARAKAQTRLGASVNWGDFTFRQLTASCALGVLLALAAMAVQMVRASSVSIRHFGFGFVVGRVWDPVANVFGALPFIWGTLASSCLALTIAIPVSFGVAVYLSELAPA